MFWGCRRGLGWSFERFFSFFLSVSWIFQILGKDDDDDEEVLCYDVLRDDDSCIGEQLVS